VTLDAWADQPGFDLCVALSRRNAGGEVLQLCTGVARWRGDSCLRAEPRQVQLQPLLATLQPGDQLRLAIGLSAWPQIAVNPGSGALPQGGSSAAHREITVQLQLGGAQLCIEAMVGAN
jgi:predicted acyl esterase